jgi:hypothetical protein
VRRPSWALAPVLILWVAALPARAAVRAWLDSGEAAPGDTVELTLEYEGQPDGAPDLAPLQKDFQVLDSNTSTSIEIVNGRSSERTQVTVSLAPRHPGRLTVPPILWSGEQSPALALNVTASPRGAAAQSRQVFFEAEVSPKQPYVQAAVRVTLRLYTREALYKPSITFDSGPAAVIRQVGSDEEGSVERGGESYEVLTRHYLMFPQRSGALSLPGPVLSAEVPRRARLWSGDPFAGAFGVSPLVGSLLATGKPIRVQGDAIALDVRPRPAAAASSYWLPAREVTLQSAWHPPALQAHVGDPVTVDLSLEAEGLTAAQLPDLTQLLTVPSGVRVYPEAAKLNDAPRDDGIVGTRTQSVALIADEPGRFTIPALHVHWWDTRSNERRDAVLPQRTVEVLPAAATAAAGASSSAAAPNIAQGAANGEARSQAGKTSTKGSAALEPVGAGQSLRPSPWLWLDGALALAWAATLFAWLRLRRRIASLAPQRPSQASLSTRDDLSVARARAAFRLACRRDDAAGARRHLLAWLGAAWPKPVPAGLNAFAKQVVDPNLGRLVRELDRACYAGDVWRGDALAAALTELPQPLPGTPGAGGSDAALAPLYPQIDAPRAGYV